MAEAGNGGPEPGGEIRFRAPIEEKEVVAGAVELGKSRAPARTLQYTASDWFPTASTALTAYSTSPEGGDASVYSVPLNASSRWSHPPSPNRRKIL